MKYTKEERLDIGQQIYLGELSFHEAANKYGINPYTARDYMRLYKGLNGLPAKEPKPNSIKLKKVIEEKDLQDYESMTKEELIDELIRAKVNEARAKKGYIVKGGGANKEFISLNNKNTK